MKYLYFIIAVGALAIVGAYNAQRLEVQAQAYADYEECAQERAGMTVSAYYEKYGYAPECY